MGRRLLLLATVALSGCVTELADPDGMHRREVRTYADAPHAGAPAPFALPAATAVVPPGLLPPSAPGAGDPRRSLSPYHSYSHQTLRAPDGRLTRMYWVRAGRGPSIEQLLRAHTLAGDANLATVTLLPNAQVDPRPDKVIPTNQAPMLALVPPGVANVSDLITVTSSEDVLLQVDQFLTALLTEVPQIEIEGKVIEINLTDALEYGVNLGIDEQIPGLKKNPNGTFSPIKKDDKSTLFDDFTSPLDPNKFLSGEAVGSLAVALIDNDIKYRAIIRAIQDSRDTQVLSAPKMAVLNGHRAIIDTGSRTPVLQPVLGSAGNLTQVQVRFEDTGVQLVVTPYLLMDDLIQIDVAAEVSFVSGFIESGATGILNPIISSRTASTVVNVRNGQTLAIGGLKSTDEIDLVTKVPILGDIPLLGYLFQTRSKTERQSTVLFLLTPRIIDRPGAPLIDPAAGR